MDWNKKVNYCDGFKKSEYKELVIIANIHNGMNFKMTKECFGILEQYFESDMTISDFLELFEDRGDREYFSEVFQTLLEYGIIVFGEEIKSYVPVFEITDRCNLHCSHCCMDAKPANCNGDMSTQEWKAIIDKFVDMNIDYIVITGGEPLIRSDFFELCEYAKQKLKVPMQLMSNATLINESNAGKLLELFDDFSFSLDGADEESCAPVRGKGVFEKALNGIRIMKEKGMKKFSLSFTKVKQNEGKVDEFITLAKELGAEPMIRNFDIVGRAKEHLELLPNDIDEQFLPVISDPGNSEGHYYPESMPLCVSCTAVDNKMCVAHDGNIYPCQVLMYPEFCICNINEIDSVVEYWKENKQYLTQGYKNFAEFHTAHSQKCKNCPVNLFCESCVLYSYLMRNRDNFEELCERKKEGLMPIWR